MSNLSLSLSKQVEALLFALGRPLSREELSQKLSVKGSVLEEAVEELREELAGRSVTLVDDGKMLELRTAPEATLLIERVRKEEYTRDIGRAGLEALAAVLYRGPLPDGRQGLTRSEIDFIRGVNSSQTLRTLTMRGLLRKISNPKDERSYLYEPTTELLAHLGVAGVTELPEYALVREKLKSLEEAYREKQKQDESPV